MNGYIFEWRNDDYLHGFWHPSKEEQCAIDRGNGCDPNYWGEYHRYVDDITVKDRARIAA